MYNSFLFWPQNNGRYWQVIVAQRYIYQRSEWDLKLAIKRKCSIFGGLNIDELEKDQRGQLVNNLILLKFIFRSFQRLAETFSQYHQHFTSNFCDNIISAKNFQAKHEFGKSCSKHVCKSNSRAKYWWNWHKQSISSTFYKQHLRQYSFDKKFLSKQ